jgi:Flp pilus assembly pilin Flp
MTRFLMAIRRLVQRGLLRLKHSRVEPQRGASAVEYGLLLVFIAAAAMATMAALGLTVQGLFAAGVLP